eukprot:s307_g19.t1
MIVDLQPIKLEWYRVSSPTDGSAVVSQWPRPTPPRLRFACVVREEATHTPRQTMHCRQRARRPDMYHDPNAGMPPPVPAAGYAYGVAPAVGQPAQYIYKGQRYGDLKQLQAAMQSSPLPTTKSSWVQLLRDKVALEKRVKELFHQYSGADRKLQPHEVHGLAFSLGAQLGVDPTAFGDIQVLFHRYDFSGDGELDESEALHLITHMLRVFRDGLQRQQHQSQALPMQPVPDFSAESIPFKQLDQAFVLQKKLGQGGQGAVYLATDRSSKLKRVVKFYNKSCANAPVEDIVEEFNLLTSLDHPKIARLYEVFQDHVYIYVVSEPYFGGDLTTCAQKATERGVALNQSWLAGILKQICAGIMFLHSKKSMHCDIKEANVMISGDTDWLNPNVVVIDFGLARDFRKGSSGVMGTPGYMPPEVWTKGVWTCKGDIFSMGVLFYNMYCLHQRRAFEGQTVQQLQAQTCGMLVDWQPLENCLSFQNLVQHMMAGNFRDRPMVNQVLQHNWWREAGKDASSPVSKEAIADLGQFKPMSDLHRALMMDMVSKENLTHLKELNALFAQLDADHSGVVTEPEARKALSGKMDPAQIDLLVKTLLGSSGTLTYSRFMAEMISAKKAENDEVLWRIFKELDADNSNSLDANEIKAMMNKPKVREIMADRTVADIMDRMDLSRTGRAAEAPQSRPQQKVRFPLLSGSQFAFVQVRPGSQLLFVRFLGENLVPREIASAVLGERGQTRQELEKASGAHIWVELRDSGLSSVQLAGAAVAVAQATAALDVRFFQDSIDLPLFAERRGKEVVRQLRETIASEGRSQDCRLHLERMPNNCCVKFTGSREIVAKAKSLVEGAIAFTELAVSKAEALQVIGKGGSRIKQLREKTGAHLEVVLDRDPCLVQIAGSPQALSVTKDELRADAPNASPAPSGDKSVSWPQLFSAAAFFASKAHEIQIFLPLAELDPQQCDRLRATFGKETLVKADASRSLLLGLQRRLTA